MKVKLKQQRTFDAFRWSGGEEEALAIVGELGRYGIASSYVVQMTPTSTEERVNVGASIMWPGEVVVLENGVPVIIDFDEFDAQYKGV